MHTQNAALIQAIRDCSSECNHCYYACLQEDDVKMLSRCIQLDRNCSDICDLTISWAASNAELLIDLKKLCARVCEECAKECEKHFSMEHCKKCAEACRKCAEECKR